MLRLQTCWRMVQAVLILCAAEMITPRSLLGEPATSPSGWSSPAAGGPGGDRFERICPAGQVLVGVRVKSGSWIDAVAPRCVAVAQDGRWIGDPAALMSTGGPGGTEATKDCPRDNAVFQIGGRADSHWYVDRLGFGCKSLTSATTVGGAATEIGPFGGSGGAPFGMHSCPNNLAATGLQGRSGDFIDRIQMLCGRHAPPDGVLEASRYNRIVAGPGELEVAVSADGRQVIVAVNGVRPLDIPPTRARLFFSINAGASFAPVSSFPRNMRNSRDPTVTWTGAGKFYFATMGSTTNVRVASSADGGQTFNAVAPLECDDDGCLGDQPHIAGDRRPGQDQVYIVWHTKLGDGRFFSELACSTDGGGTWLRRIVEENVGPSERRGFFPRLTVGPDGFVYVIMPSSYTDGDLLLQRFSPCRSGLTPRWTDGEGRSAPSRIGHFSGVKCESSLFGVNTVAGLDRCNNGNVLASPTVAVDDWDARRVFVSYADQTSQGNHDVVLIWTDDVMALQRDEAFLNRVVVNREAEGERYHPWSCATQGRIHVGWYDRRSRTKKNNDNTEYFVGDNQGLETEVSDGIDRQCASGWPSGGARQEAEACSRQPQFAGFCLACSAGSRVDESCDRTPVRATPRCDYSSGACPAGLSCVEPSKNRGSGRYGDYNGIACAQGSAYVAWVSANAPSVLLETAGLSVFFARVDLAPKRPAPPASQACIACKESRDSCTEDARTNPDIRRCVVEFKQCSARHDCR